MDDKGTCDKGFIWNPINCECECDKSSNIGEYLDYENCQFRKKLVHKLVEECNENVEEIKLAKITSTKDEHRHKNKCSSGTLYIVLFSIIFIMNVGVCTYFVHYKHMNRDEKNCCKIRLYLSSKTLTIFRMSIFGAAHRWGEPKSPLPKICHTYPTMTKLDTVIPYLKKIEKIY